MSAVAPVPVHGHCDARFARVRELFAAALADGTELGAAACFVLDGVTVVDLWGGHCDWARTREWRRDTLVNVYSTTKALVALCALQLIERGVLALEAPVSRWWPEYAAAGKGDTTVRQLMGHRAGQCAVREPLPGPALYDWQRMCGALAAQAPWWTPGDGHGYHAFTYGFLVGELVRRISGVGLGAYLREHVAGPLDADFHVGLPAALDARVADMHSAYIGNRPPPPPDPAAAEAAAQFAEFGRRMQDPASMQSLALLNPPQPRDAVNTRAWRGAEIPAVNGHGTARALARILGALARGGELDGVRLLDANTIARATQEEAAGPERLFCGAVPMRFGLGFVLNDQSHRYARFSPNQRAFGHAGGGGSLAMADPDLKIGFGFTMNNMQASIASAGATPTQLVDAFYEALGWRPG